MLPGMQLKANKLHQKNMPSNVGTPAMGRKKSANVPPINIVPIGSVKAANSTYFGAFFLKMYENEPVTTAPDIPPGKAKIDPIDNVKRKMAKAVAVMQAKPNPTSTPIIPLIKCA